MEKLKKKKYNFWCSPVALLLFFIILLFFIYKILDLVKKERETSFKKNLIFNEFNDLKERKDLISEKIMKLETGYGEEEIIREKYHLVQEGEKMIVIVDEEIKEENNNEEVNFSFFDRLKNYFKR